jgi:tetratricopeptide (TPR) repeat protein
LRRAVGGLMRRRDWAYAGEGCLALACLLMRRGRLSDAQLILQDAAACWSRSGERLRLVDVAILRGEALIDLVRVEEAEAVLSTAVAAARSDDVRSRLPHALIGLARALFWAGRYAEAEETVRSVDERADVLLAYASVATKVAVGSRSLDVAITRAAEAMSDARKSGEPRRVAIAAYVAAFAHLAVGDLVAVERDVTESVAAARSAHDPLQAARSRLILVESLRRSGRAAAAGALLNRLNKIPAAVLPPIIRARRDLLRDVLSERAPVQQVVERHIAATGLKALRLHVGPSVTSGLTTNTLDPTVDDIVEILQICQRSDDDTAILIEVCRRSRSRLHAAAVALVSVDGSSCRIVASDGSRIELTVADRAVGAGITLAPHRGHDRIEAAAPVRYGGAIIGALVSRWAIATPHDLSGAASLLTGAAAAVGPILSAAMARRVPSSHPATIPLLGTSAAMASVRDAVERAATAPFAVLVEGAIDPQ